MYYQSTLQTIIMKIANDRTIKDLQTDFQKVFPFLKIEFYKTPHGFGEETINKSALSADLRLGDMRTLDNYGVMLLDKTMKTSEFEKLLAKIYGLNVQVFRKSYGKWLQTWATDNWTLQEQNDRSAVMGDKSFEKPKDRQARTKAKIFN